jgi:hypothetical protein
MTYGENKPAVTIAPNGYEIRKAVEIQDQFNQSVSAAINSHASKIAALHEQMGNLVAFMEWVGNTHPDVFQQYHAIKDLERASNG